MDISFSVSDLTKCPMQALDKLNGVETEYSAETLISFEKGSVCLVN